MSSHSILTFTTWKLSKIVIGQIALPKFLDLHAFCHECYSNRFTKLPVIHHIYYMIIHKSDFYFGYIWRTFYLLTYYFIEKWREKERRRNINVRNIYQMPLVHAPTGDQTCNPSTCPDLSWPGIKPATFWFMGLRSNQVSHSSQG